VSTTIPVGVLTVVTGVAGSGKSSLINDELSMQNPDVVLIDQGAIRGSRRSTPATFLGILDRIRRLFADANQVGIDWFSANSTGACEVCHGLGVIVTDLAFMDDVTLACDACGGTRFNNTALGYQYHGRNLHEILSTTVDDASALFDDDRIIGAILRMEKTGLGYLTLGQSLDTLSGGERQRLKLAKELASPSTIYVFDEPTTGLHGQDVARLLMLFDQMIDDGATLIVIEHNLDVMAHADWIIDMGPGAGADGGAITFEGTTSDLVHKKHNATAEHLSSYIRP
jgi:excinuclease UvrABC ATPase subunit